MTDMEQALTISGIIFGIMMLSQYGRRKYTLHKLVMPIISVSVIGYYYLKDMPTASVDWVVYGVGALVGVIFGVIATAATGVELDRNGKVYTRCGAGFVSAWLTVILLRVAFIFAADHVTVFRNHLGEFMQQHSIVVDAIAPFFVIMALAMVVSRVAFVRARAGSVKAQGVYAPESRPVVAAGTAY